VLFAASRMQGIKGTGTQRPYAPRARCQPDQTLRMLGAALAALRLRPRRSNGRAVGGRLGALLRFPDRGASALVGKAGARTTFASDSAMDENQA
jgi:hypothetical protein